MKENTEFILGRFIRHTTGICCAKCGGPNTKLDWDKVRYIREHKDSYSREQLSNKFGVGVGAIKNVITNKTWKR